MAMDINLTGSQLVCVLSGDEMTTTCEKDGNEIQTELFKTTTMLAGPQL